VERNVPVAIISAWLGHADTAFTMRTYVHNQPEKLALAAESISSWTRRKKAEVPISAARRDGKEAS
jgi:integrase